MIIQPRRHAPPPAAAAAAAELVFDSCTMTAVASPPSSATATALGSFLAELIRSNDAFTLADSRDDCLNHVTVTSIELLVDNPVSRSPLSPRSRRRRRARAACEEPSRGVCRWNSSEEFHLCQTCSSRRRCTCQNNPLLMHHHHHHRSRLLPHVPTRRTSLSPMGKNEAENEEEQEQQQLQEAVEVMTTAPPRMPRRSSDTSCTSTSSSSTFATATTPMVCASPKMDRLSTCSSSSSSSSSFASPVAPLTLNELLSYGNTKRSNHQYAVTVARPILTFPKTPALHRTTVRTAAVNALDASRQHHPANERSTTLS